jgi:hypothetical protein
VTESPPILADIRDEASSIAAEVTAAGLPVRLLGGVAFWLRCPSVRSGPFARDYADLDFAVSKPASQRFRAILEGRGYLPDKFFNGLHGATRLYYGPPDGQWSVDIVIDELTMSHRLDLRASSTARGRRSARPTCCSPSSRCGRSTARTWGTPRACWPITAWRRAQLGLTQLGLTRPGLTRPGLTRPGRTRSAWPG